MKKKTFKIEANQLPIKGYISTPKNTNSYSDSEEYTASRPRTESRKRKKNSPPSELLKLEQKRLFISTNNQPAKMGDQEQDTSEKLTLQAVKDLLEPLDIRMSKVLSTQEEMKTTIGEAVTLKTENERLKQRMSEIEEKNEQLSRRLSDLENRLLVNNVVFTGVHESAWELEEA